MLARDQIPEQLLQYSDCVHGLIYKTGALHTLITANRSVWPRPAPQPIGSN